MKETRALAPRGPVSRTAWERSALSNGRTKRSGSCAFQALTLSRAIRMCLYLRDLH